MVAIMSATELAAAVKALPIDEKLELWEIVAVDIIDSADPSVRAAQVDEVLRRERDWAAGKTKLIPGDDVMARARALAKTS